MGAVHGEAPEALRAIALHPYDRQAAVRSDGRRVLAFGRVGYLADLRTGRTRVVAKGIGRSIHRMPDGGVSFVLREGSDGGPARFTVMRLDPASREVRRLVAAVEGTADADLAWMPDGTLLMAAADALHAWREGDEGLSLIHI